MKRILLAVIVLGSAMAMQSCNNGDYKATPTGNLPNPPGGGVVINAKLTCKIDGTPVTISTVAFTEAAGNLTFGGGNGAETVSLNTMGTAVGDYQVDNTHATAGYISSSITLAGNSGKITITSYDGSVLKGTFNFSDGTHNVTDGEFTIKK